MASIIRATTTSGLQVAPDNSGSLQLQTNGTTAAVTIDTSQNVGIGTTSPGTKLDVTGSIRASQSITFGSGGTYQAGSIYADSNFGMILRPVTSSPAVAQLRLINSADTTTYLEVDPNGIFKFNSGYGSAATAYGCRAWVNFNGTGTVAIRGSGNVSSITDGGVGIYTVNFTNAMPDANYSWSGLCGSPGVTNGFILVATPLAASVPITALNTAFSLFDPTYVTVMVMR
jgi:hypothetical protein